jgi:uncharacterized membrane protein YozB (DUF420 family)
MDWKFAFWSLALTNLFVICALVAAGIQNVRHGRINRHRRCMQTAAYLVGSFVIAYALKLAVLGREQLSTWSPQAVTTLRIHEAFVLMMILGGSAALIRARQMRATQNASRNPEDPMAPATTSRGHRRAGWTAAFGAALGFATAVNILVEMYSRTHSHGP